MRALAALAAAIALLSGPAHAQEATLIADSLAINADQTLVAEGNVEIFYGEARLQATRVTYDRAGDSIAIEGPLILTDGAGSVILADSAELDTDLTDGILRSARLVLEQQLQIAAAEISRAGGRYARLSRIVASSCEICESGAVPLWEIRASRVIRDEEELQLYFDNAQLRVAGLPVFYIPRLRLPDPSLDRASGFLVPELETRSRLGTGLKTPYFFTLGDHADLTLTPYLSSSTTTLEGRFRQRLGFGRIDIEGAVSNDDIEPDARGYLFLDSVFDLPRDFTLRFDLELVSDEAYLLDYGYSSKDRLDSALSVERTRDDQQARAALTSFRTLRASEIPIDREIPNELGEASLNQRLFADPVFGQGWMTLGAVTLERPSSDPGTGRDVSRLSAGLNWTASATLPAGFVGEAQLAYAVDHYIVGQDASFDDQITRLTPSAGVSLAWPLARTGAGGAYHLLEPKVQLAWADTSGGDVPNEDSTVVEFDEGNLFALSRFPGTDAVEEGLHANMGLGWTRYDPDGWSVAATLGKVYRFEDPGQFGPDTGLSGRASDWLVALHYSLGTRLDVTSRSLIDDNLDINLSETRFALAGEDYDLGGSYLFRAAEPLEARFEDISELALDGGYRFNDFWSARADWRFEADAGNTTEAGLALRYENECVGVDLSVSRRFTSSTAVEPVTDIALRVTLAGFGSGPDRRAARRRCGG